MHAIPAPPLHATPATSPPDPSGRAILDAIALPVAVVDGAGIVLMANPRFRQEFGEPAAGRPLHEATGGLGRPEDLARALEAMRGRRLAEFRIASQDGSRVYLVSGQPIEGGRGLLVALADHAGPERLAAELQRRAAALERSNADLQQFAYVASHDLQEPLRMVASYTQVLAETHQGRLGPEADGYIHFIVDGAQRMQRLVNDLLEYARVSTKAQPLVPTPAGHAVEAALAALADTVKASGAFVSVGPMPTVLADGARLTQVFQNLLSNALKFHGPEPPRIRVEARRAGAAWEVCVADQGIGIDPRYFPRLFVLFQRLHTKDAYSGTGIGLALCKKIVELHGGRIWVESAPGKGATFRFTLAEALP